MCLPPFTYFLERSNAMAHHGVEPIVLKRPMFHSACYTTKTRSYAPLTKPSHPNILPRRFLPALQRQPPKTKKYLEEHQRCEIVLRVRAGERQAHLAREYGITRAAVCYLLRHQWQILDKYAANLAKQSTNARRAASF
ncbi:hypothetical protein PINS_up001041 [Pythium insidiosum]|nr:hypothetical protein PINS_up001041 [Pythium insidiosum]